MYNYLKRTMDYKLFISKGNNVLIEDMPIQTFFNKLLKRELTDLTSRERITKRVIHLKSKIPIYVDKDTMFMCIKSYRLKNSFYINYFSIKSYEYIDNEVIVHFLNRSSLKTGKKHSFQAQMKKCRLILDYLN